MGGARFITGFTMLVHMFWAEMFVGFALAAPVLQAWGARTGSPRMDRLAHSMARFNVLTFSTGATFAVLFVVLLVGLYPRVTTSLFTHFFYFIALAMLSMVLALWGMYSYYYKWDRYSVLNKKRHIALGFTMGFFIWIWMVIMTGIDTYMVTGGAGRPSRSRGSTIESFSTAVQGHLQPHVHGDGPAQDLRQPLLAGLRPRRLGLLHVRPLEDLRRQGLLRLEQLRRPHLGRGVPDAEAARGLHDRLRAQALPAGEPGEPGRITAPTSGSPRAIPRTCC